MDNPFFTPQHVKIGDKIKAKDHNALRVDRLAIEKATLKREVIETAVVDIVSKAVEGLELNEDEELALFVKLKRACHNLTEYIYQRK